MKASRYVKPFEVEVDRWERTLSLIMEVIEMILTVQRQWMYLEVTIDYVLLLLINNNYYNSNLILPINIFIFFIYVSNI